MEYYLSSILDFKPINLERDWDLCVKFRTDSFVCSFGSAENFYQKNGKGSEFYWQWLRQRIKEIPNLRDKRRKLGFCRNVDR